jgi:hypothetical protein
MLKTPLVVISLIISITCTHDVWANKTIENHKSVKALITQDGLIHLSHLREECNFLTDDDIKQQAGTALPKRNKGFKRHIKRICETLELKAWMEQKATAQDIQLVYELELIKATYLEKAQRNDQVSVLSKIKMGITSLLTPITLNYKIQPTQDINLQDKIFYNHNELVEKHKRFNELEKAKKIQTKDQMFILFDAVSDSGSAPKIKAIDIKDAENEWSLKWGDELHSDVVGSRIFAALGFDIDHPYYYGKNEVYLILPKNSSVNSGKELQQQVLKQFKIDISKFILDEGTIGEDELALNKHLKPLIGLKYIRFIECALEARPDRVKRIGSIVPKQLQHPNRPELRAAILAHLFIDNWDTREENTLISINHLGDYQYKTSGVFSDLGTSMGVHLNLAKGDFRVGLVNEFSWDLVKRKNKKIIFNAQLNSVLKPYAQATYSELRWMAEKIAGLNQHHLEKILEKSGWPEPIQTLYLHKLASRRAQILQAFEITDPHPIAFDRKLNLNYQGRQVIKDGQLIEDIELDRHPLGYLNSKGRMQNYGAAHVN